MIHFTKMHGLGNDFIVIDDLRSAAGKEQPVTRELAMRICDRRFGVGADQILWLRKSQADARMEILNADGSIAEMCGNGIRAVALYLFDHGPRPGMKSYRIETLAGLKEVEISGTAPAARLVKVNMGMPVVHKESQALALASELAREPLPFHEVNVGNPHAVIFVPQVREVPIEKLGPAIENHPRFPNRTNVEFVEIHSPSRILVRVWERGAGVTLACGTGACASAVAALATRRVQGPVQVVLPGGELVIDWAGEGHPVLMSGPAQEVFRGEYLA